MGAKVLKDWEVKMRCWSNEVYVIAKPIQSGYKKGGYPVMLTIDFQKSFKKGVEVYEQNSKELEDKINEIYRYLYENNIK
tara:strand:+ start:3254 stop:3493 length:240 start_codon:yes stop_codon:yes gene_type:complete